MGLFGFVKDVGEKLFGKGTAQAAETPAAGAPADAGQANAKAAAAITAYIQALKLAPADLAVEFNGATGVVTVKGTAPDQATRERILLAAGNVEGVGQVDDQLSVANAEPEAQFYTVVSGDTLSKIAKNVYGNANKYPVIFEANRPMLTHPDKIYPGQVLRIPAQS